MSWFGCGALWGYGIRERPFPHEPPCLTDLAFGLSGVRTGIEVGATFVVRLDRVSKDYRRNGGVVPALHQVSLHVPGGQFCAIMGPSGCGKTTLLNLIAGLDQPTSGDILIAGRPTKSLSDADWTALRRDCIGMVFQAFHLIPGLTVAENVGLPLLLRGEGGQAVQ